MPPQLLAMLLMGKDLIAFGREGYPRVCYYAQIPHDVMATEIKKPHAPASSGQRELVLGGFLKDFSEWWFATLRACWPGFWSRPSTNTQHVLIRKNGIEISEGEHIHFVAPDGDASGELLQTRMSKRTASTIVALESDRYIIRTLSPLRLPASRARAMMALDLGSNTPFKSEEVYCFALSPTEKAQSMATAYAIVKHSVLDPVLDVMRTARLHLSGVILRPAAPEASGSPAWMLSPGDLRQLNDGIKGRRRRMVALAWGSLLLGLAGTAVHIQWNYAAAQHNAEERLSFLEPKARTVRETLNKRAAAVAKINALRAQLATQRSISEIWEEISKTLPDTAYLTDLHIKDGAATLIGFSSSASSLIAPLENAPMFEDAVFVSPVIKVAGKQGERFEIKLQVVSR